MAIRNRLQQHGNAILPCEECVNGVFASQGTVSTPVLKNNFAGSGLVQRRQRVDGRGFRFGRWMRLEDPFKNRRRQCKRPAAKSSNGQYTLGLRQIRIRCILTRSLEKGAQFEITRSLPRCALHGFSTSQQADEGPLCSRDLQISGIRHSQAAREAIQQAVRGAQLR